MARVNTADGTQDSPASSTTPVDEGVTVAVQESPTAPPLTTVDDAPAPGDPGATSTSDPTERPAMKELNGIRFNAGQVDERRISADDLRKHNVEPKSDDDLVWNADNGHLVAVGQVNAATLDFLLTQDGFTAE